MKKKKSLLPLLLAASFCIVGIGCSDEEESQEKNLQISPDCKRCICSPTDFARFTRDEEGGNEAFEYKSLSDGRMYIKHRNTVFDCEKFDVNINISVEGQRIIVTETASEVKDDCIGIYDVDYEVKGLSEGDYTVIVKNKPGSVPERKFNIHYSDNLEGTYVVRRIYGIPEANWFSCEPDGEYEADVLHDYKMGEDAASSLSCFIVTKAPEAAWDGAWPYVGDTLLADKPLAGRTFVEGNTAVLKVKHAERHFDAPHLWFVKID